MTWVSTYTEHKFPDTDFGSIPFSEFASALAQSRIRPDLLPTAERMSREELASITDAQGTSRAHLSFRPLDKSIYETNFRRALLNRDIWPNLRVEFIWCTMSIWESVCSAWYLAQVMGKDENHRNFAAHSLEANHFVRSEYLVWQPTMLTV